ncbi:hypothetical protein Goarm_000482 [Gossypium armourianum]|uniref:Uncharacterized protein n=1 Tax=Gossypium armourianum TaxID=34283 RepID=A0A7J9KAK0_9ROSI|nr:hypothetical protein [Gossypium armourianum]
MREFGDQFSIIGSPLLLMFQVLKLLKLRLHGPPKQKGLQLQTQRLLMQSSIV